MEKNAPGYYPTWDTNRPKNSIEVQEVTEPKIKNKRRGSESLRFEEWPPRLTKRSICVTYKLTDGKQINTGSGRTSRALGYVMEIANRRWVARVNNRCSEPLTLAAAKEAAIGFYRSRDKGEPQDWINHHNRSLAAAMDRTEWKRLRSGWPIDLMGGQKRPEGFKRLEIDGGLNSKGQERYVLDVEMAA